MRPLSLAIIGLTCSPAFSMQTPIVGPRALGMAGANVASTDDGTAQFYNPAAFGFMGGDSVGLGLSDNNDLSRKKWGVEASVEAGLHLHDQFARYLDLLSQVETSGLSDNSGVNTEAELQ